MFKLTPSLLTFGLNCPACFYASVKNGWKKPYEPFPSVFGAIDRCVRSFWHGRSVRELSFPGLGENIIFDTQEYWLKSAPIQIGGHQPFKISGKTDCLLCSPSTIAGVIDFKVSGSIKPELLEIYSRQLHLYAWALERPAEGAKFRAEPGSIQHLALLVYKPEAMISPGQLDFQQELLQIKRDDDWFSGFLEEILRMLEAPLPPPSNPTDCHWCIVRLYGLQNS